MGRTMGKKTEIVRCPECGIEARVDIRNKAISSFAFPTEELQYKCKHYDQSSKNQMCPSLQTELVKLADSMVPSGIKQ
jgi:hypothetical protein